LELVVQATREMIRIPVVLQISGAEPDACPELPFQHAGAE
jgi:hypothetical protein